MDYENNDISEPVAKAPAHGLECPQGFPAADWEAKTDDEKRAWWAMNNTLAGGAK